MNYRTACPHCASVFRLGPDQLDAAQGWVQCGVCGAAFDARPALLHADGSPLPAAAANPPEPATAEATLPAPAAAEPADALPADALPADTAPPPGVPQHEAVPELSSIILIDPDQPPADGDPGPLPQIPSTMPPLYPPHPGSAPRDETAAAAGPAMAQIEYAHAQPRPAAADSGWVAPVPRRSRTGRWAAASLLLVLLLAAQLTYFLRDTLVSTWPQTRPALEQACAALGCTLSLPKKLTQLQIVGSDLQIEPNGNLVLALTLGNRAAQAQAWPVLVLTLTDQRSRALTRRSFAPSEYLGDAPRIAAGIPPRTEQFLSLPLAVQGLTPMGFDLQLVY